MLNVFHPETRWLRQKNQSKKKSEWPLICTKSIKPFSQNSWGYLRSFQNLKLQNPVRTSCSFIFPHICCHKLAWCFFHVDGFPWDFHGFPMVTQTRKNLDFQGILGTQCARWRGWREAGTAVPSKGKRQWGTQHQWLAWDGGKDRRSSSKFHVFHPRLRKNW